MGQPGFFDAEERLRWLSASGDPLERLRAVVDFEAFRAELEAALPRADRSRGGRPPWDVVLMFRVLVLQALYTLSDDQAEYQLRDRLVDPLCGSTMRFAGLALQDAVPDATTIWLYRQQLTRAGALAKLFARFDAMLAERGFLAMGRQIVDTTVVEARRPRLTKEEKAILRDGGTPEAWSKARTRQIDRDGRWTLKRGRRAKPPEGGGASRQAVVEIAVPVFGYKNHLGIDRAHGSFIRRFVVTDAARHDGGQLGAVVHPGNTGSGVWADRRYASAWLYAAVRPGTDEGFALVLTETTAAAMRLFLDRFAAALPAGVHAALPLDHAGWHTAQDLVVPANLSLVHLPPYSPELSPPERIWLYLRERFLSHRLFADLGAVIDGCANAWNRLVGEPGRIASLTAYPYLLSVRI